ncbi:MAG: hypothetical protein LWW77_11090 [Propionibacteriales bacterium]|nr:hypothetical protein [Propionibacteriales bacterium]
MIRIALLILAVALAAVFLQLAEPRSATPAPTASQGQLAVPDSRGVDEAYEVTL